MSALQQPIAIQTDATGMIAILREYRRASTVRSDSKISAMSRTTAGGRLQAITSPSANQQTAVNRGARRNSSGGTRATAFGQRSGFGASTLPVFEALPADRTHEPFHHKVTSSSAQNHHRFEMKRLWKHVDHMNLRDVVAGRNQQLCVPGKSHRIAGDVDDLRRRN